MEATSPNAPIACSLSPEGLAERGGRWCSLAERVLVGVAGTRDGLRLSFGVAPGVEAEVRDLVGLELECCAFASWTVHVIGESVVLDVTGTSPESVAEVREMFTGLRQMGTDVRRGDGGGQAW